MNTAGRLLLFSTLLLTGCGLGIPSNTPGVASADEAMHLSGIVHGGQQPVSGATLQLWQVGTAGYGSAPTKLGSGATSASDGSFLLTGTYTCPSSSTLVYLTATGGNPGLTSGTNNTALSLLLALGPCGNLTSSETLILNEVSTVASVYSLAQFMSATGGIGAPAASPTGIRNAFATVNSLLSNGGAPSSTPGGNGVVPNSEINTLADILVPCVNSSGPTSSPCASLFSAVTPTGGAAPSNTLAAMLDIALNPGNNVANIFGLAGANAAFQPTLTAAPNDWTIAIGYSIGLAPAAGSRSVAIDGGGNVWLTSEGQTGTINLLSPVGVPASNSPYAPVGASAPTFVAVDSANNAWVVDNSAGNIVELTAVPSGTATAIAPVSGPYVGLANFPNGIAIDASNDVWVTSTNSSAVVELLHSGGSKTYTGGGLNVPFGIAIDLLGNAWVANFSGSSVTKINPATSTLTSYTGGGQQNPYSIAVDQSDNVWAVNANGHYVVELNSSGVPLSGSTGYYANGGLGTGGCAIDGNGNFWGVNESENTFLLAGLIELSPSGVLVPPTGVYQGGLMTGSPSVAIDGSGNIWVADTFPYRASDAHYSGPYVNLSEFVGIAAPTKPPLGPL